MSPGSWKRGSSRADLEGRAFQGEHVQRPWGGNGIGVSGQRRLLWPLSLPPLARIPNPHPIPEASLSVSGRSRAFPAPSLNSTSQSGPAPKTFVARVLRLVLPGKPKPFVLRTLGLSTWAFLCWQTPWSSGGIDKTRSIPKQTPSQPRPCPPAKELETWRVRESWAARRTGWCNAHWAPFSQAWEVNWTPQHPTFPPYQGKGVSSEEVGEGNHRPQSRAGVADEGPAVQASPGSCRVTHLEGSPGGRGEPHCGFHSLSSLRAVVRDRCTGCSFFWNGSWRMSVFRFSLLSPICLSLVSHSSQVLSTRLAIYLNRDDLKSEFKGC